MKKFLFPLVAVMILMMTSCKSYKQVPYFQNADSISYAASKGLFDARIMPKDVLVINVKTTDPMAAAPFNSIVNRTINSDGDLSNGYGSMMPYLVENDGTIEFPIIGKIYVQGLTKNEVQDLIRDKISPYLSKEANPIVKVMMSSYRVTVMGEVTRPCVVPVGSEKMSILEALATAGDLTIYGKRENVLLIRENPDKQKETHRIDLTDARLINSPYYYLKQNDVIYVEPNTTKAKNSSMGQSTSIWISVIGSMVSVISLVYNIAH
jgi:polysaccharide export outer membrane protein